ncbi:MAG: LamG-like jellyroll fold domain-containing protein, partial [Candidatus Heimdallarchaeota archaeon]
ANQGRCRFDGAGVVMGSQTVANKLINDGTAIPTGAYSHVVIVRESNVMTVYIDNVDTGNSISLTGTVVVNNFGGKPNYGTGIGFYDGDFDEIVIWDAAKSSGEVSELYNSGNGLAYPYVAAPTIQATNVLSSDVLTTIMTLDWNRGDGDKVAVFMKETSSGTPAPVDNTTYSADANFGDGDEIASSGWFCVYNGTGTTMDVTGLTLDTGYRIMAVEYNE